MDGLINFSNTPLSLLTYAGWLCLFVTVLGGTVSIVQACRQEIITGWWIVALALFGCTGLQLLGAGDNVKPIVIGTVIVLAVVLDAYRDRFLRAIESR